MNEIYLAGGCFWGTEKYLGSIRGVISTEVGYANGNTLNPTYEEVCHKNTGHAETVKVIYDPNVITLDFLLGMYYKSINPVSVNRQGGDIGSQYRTGIYYVNEADIQTIKASIDRLQKDYGKPIAVEVKELVNYSRAEEYHQKYLDKNPGGYCHIPGYMFEKAAQAVVDPSAYSTPDLDTLKENLNPRQFNVTQNSATESPFQSELNSVFEEGIYVDITTGEPLFTSTDKFDAGCGWPSFSKPIDPDVIKELQDSSHSMKRTEVRSRVGDAHLGHLFDDGPADKGGMRYCINGASLRFVPKDKMETEGYGYLLSFL